MRRLLYALAAAAALPASASADAPIPDPARQHELVRMVRQDCGSCHGMTLAGGLGPALTRAALADKPLESLAAVIEHGRPGTPMPPWRSMLRPGESRWIAERLLAGFPEESR
ncbi:cytochrome c [Piscinibacter sp.]|uniref:c-type cytochrome n=1 Tax=Piscinibacter sp. TaxID=1903157 RepID=UPI0035B2A738